MVWHAILRAIISGKWQRVILQPRKIAGWTQSRSQSQIANENEWKSPLNTIGRNCQTRGLMKRSGRSWKADQLFQVKGCKKNVTGCDFRLLLSMCYHENVLGSSWIIRCQNESCPSQSNNSAFTKTEKENGFEVNRATILGLGSTSCGHAAASTFLSFIGPTPINKYVVSGIFYGPLSSLLTWS